jgi:hypothetical protein
MASGAMSDLVSKMSTTLTWPRASVSGKPRKAMFEECGNIRPHVKTESQQIGRIMVVLPTSGAHASRIWLAAPPRNMAAGDPATPAPMLSVEALNCFIDGKVG